MFCLIFIIAYSTFYLIKLLFYIFAIIHSRMKVNDLVGFADPSVVSNIDEDNEIANIKKKVSKKSGGFQSMALSFPVLKGILKRGYKIPTPIQRKVLLKNIL